MILIPAVFMGEVAWPHRLVLAAALVAPLPTALVLALLLVRGRPPADSRSAMGREATLLLEVLASLQAGRTLRMALAGVSDEIERLVVIGAASDELACAVRRALPEQGAAAAAAVRLLDQAGGPAAAVIQELATQATETERIRRELRSAVAAPVLQGVIVGGAPLAVLAYLVSSGGFVETFSASPAHALTVSTGAVMTVIGVAWVATIVRRAMP
jgi:Flp pilus assembly protein TadB